MVNSKLPHSADSVTLTVGSRLSCRFKIICSVQLHCLPSELICLEVQTEELELKGKVSLSSNRKYKANAKALGCRGKLKTECDHLRILFYQMLSGTKAIYSTCYLISFQSNAISSFSTSWDRGQQKTGKVVRRQFTE